MSVLNRVAMAGRFAVLTGLLVSTSGLATAMASPATGSSIAALPTAPSITLSKGASAVGQPNCSHPSCGYLHIKTANFSGGSMKCTVQATDGTLPSFTWGPNQEGDDTTDYYGFPGNWIRVTCAGVTSNTYIWPSS